MTQESPRLDPDGDGESATDELVRADDRVIARAFRWSLLAFASIALTVGAVVVFNVRDETPPPVEEARTVLPERQAASGEPPVVRFTDITDAAGISFRHENGARGAKLLPETMGPGCAFLDYDGDGDPDLLLVGGRPWTEDGTPGNGTSQSGTTSTDPSLALYRNDGGRFTDVTSAAGLGVSLYGMGAAAGDWDNDGDADIFVTAVGTNRLWRNDAGRFAEVTETAGIGGDADAWSTSACFFDADNDGDLDIFVCNYVRWSPEIDSALGYQLVGVGRAYGPPTNFEGTQPFFYRNNGDGTFYEAAAAAGLHVVNPATGAPSAKALAVIPFDVDSDGWLDLFVANDTVRNFLFRNKGDGTFYEAGEELGVAYDTSGAATGAMGVDAAYYRNDGTVGIGVGNFANEMSSFYVAEEGFLLFSDESIAEGVGPVSRQLLSFGLFFFDYDLDGRLDLFQTNGHLEEEINRVQPSQHYRQPSQLFWNAGPAFSSCFVPIDDATTGDLARAVVGRGAAYADVDGDGDLDVLVTQTGDRPLLLRNDQDLGHGWLRITLRGRRAPRDGIGARVEVDAAGVTQRQQVMPTRSYLSQVETTLTFGLGSSAVADEVRVYWPGRAEAQRLGGVAAGSRLVIEED